MNICACKFDYYKGVGLGVCKNCGGLTCTFMGCFIPNHDCRNEKVIRR